MQAGGDMDRDVLARDASFVETTEQRRKRSRVGCRARNVAHCDGSRVLSAAQFAKRQAAYGMVGGVANCRVYVGQGRRGRAFNQLVPGTNGQLDGEAFHAKRVAHLFHCRPIVGLLAAR